MWLRLPSCGELWLVLFLARLASLVIRLLLLPLAHFHLLSPKVVSSLEYQDILITSNDALVYLSAPFRQKASARKPHHHHHHVLSTKVRDASNQTKQGDCED